MIKILIIEDNEDIRSNTAEILELSNYDVLMAENGRIGLEKAKEYKPDLIICDILMPELDGFGVLSALRKDDRTKTIPFIFLTAKTERSDLNRGLQSGAAFYLVKPFEMSTLLKTVEDACIGESNDRMA